MPEIQSIKVPAIRDVAPLQLPAGPPVTLDLGLPILVAPQGEFPSFEPMEYTPHQFTPIPLPVAPSTQKDDEDKSEAGIEIPPIRGLPKPTPAALPITQEAGNQKPFLEKAIDGLPPVEAVVTTTTIALVAATAALVAKPFSDLILKLIKPTVKKVVKKVSQARGKPVKVDSVWERRLAQRDRNRAIRALRRALKP